jgi:hypothetical protein
MLPTVVVGVVFVVVVEGARHMVSPRAIRCSKHRAEMLRDAAPRRVAQECTQKGGVLSGPWCFLRHSHRPACPGAPRHRKTSRRVFWRDGAGKQQWRGGTPHERRGDLSIKHDALPCAKPVDLRRA